MSEDEIQRRLFSFIPPWSSKFNSTQDLKDYKLFISLVCSSKETYSWFPLKDCIKLLEQYTYACFAHPDHSSLKSLKSSRSLYLLPYKISTIILKHSQFFLGNSSSDNVSEVAAGQTQVLIRGIGALPLSVCYSIRFQYILLPLILCIKHDLSTQETNVFSHPYLRDVFLEAITDLGLELSNRVLFTV